MIVNRKIVFLKRIFAVDKKNVRMIRNGKKQSKFSVQEQGLYVFFMEFYYEENYTSYRSVTFVQDQEHRLVNESDMYYKVWEPKDNSTTKYVGNIP